MPITLAHLKRLGFTLFVLAAIVATETPDQEAELLVMPG